MSDLSIIRVSGSNATPTQHVPANVVNTNPDTHFSSAGVGSFVDLEVAKESDINTIVIQFYNGRHKKTKFSVATTKDFAKFEPAEPATFVSDFNDDNQTFHIKKTKAKGLRISFEGNAVDDANKGPINGVAGTGTGTGRPTHLGVIQNNSFLPGPLSYSADPTEVNVNPSLRPTHLGVIPQVQNDHRNLFEVRSIAVLNTELEKDQEKNLNEQIKATKEALKDCKECKCIRCGEKTDGAICPKCGLKGDYNHPEAAHIASVFPSTVSAGGVHVKQLDTTPSKTIPSQGQTREITTVPPGMTAQSGNAIVVGTEVIPEGGVSRLGVSQVGEQAAKVPIDTEQKVHLSHSGETGFGNENTPTKQATDAANQGKSTNQTADDRSKTNTPYTEGDHYTQNQKDTTVSTTKENNLEGVNKAIKKDQNFSQNISQQTQKAAQATTNNNNTNNKSTQTQSNNKSATTTQDLSKDDQTTPSKDSSTAKKVNKDGTVVEADTKTTTTIK